MEAIYLCESQSLLKFADDVWLKQLAFNSMVSLKTINKKKKSICYCDSQVCFHQHTNTSYDSVNQYCSLKYAKTCTKLKKNYLSITETHFTMKVAVGGQFIAL